MAERQVMSIEIPQDVIEMNREIIEALNNDQIDLSRKYTVEHHFSSTNFTQLEKLAVDLFQDDFEIIDPDEIEEDGIKFFCFDALKECRISAETILEQQSKIFERLHKFHVNYDGWGVDTTVYDE